MKVQDIMERALIPDTGKAIAYIKDGLEEMNMYTETHVKTARSDIKRDKRYYDIPFDAVKIIAIRCKNQSNADNKYKEIPRSAYTPAIGDSDGI